MFRFFVALLGALQLALLLFCGGCDKAAALSSEEKEVISRAVQIAVGINALHNSTGEVPEEIGEVEALLPDTISWPRNVYTGEPMVDTKSKDFDAATSPGNVFYNKVYREEQIVLWELHAFGEHDTVKIFTAIEAAKLEKKRKR